MVTAIIVAAGSSRRMGFNKLLAPLCGKPVVAHAIAAFQQCPVIEEIVLVAREDQLDQFQNLVRTQRLGKVKEVVTGGPERHLSVWNGLQRVSTNASFIAIHDGARPLTTPALIRSCLDLAKKHGAACCASPIPDTVKRASDEKLVTESVERANLWSMQTPQVFSSGVILQAYAALIASNEVVTDEVSAVQKSGKKIALLRNDDWNFKITFPRDLELAEQILRGRRNDRSKR